MTSDPVATSFGATLEDLPWREVEGFPGVGIRFLGESMERGPWVLQVRHPPGYVEPRHWHEADTIYVFTKGEMTVAGEATYAPGDVRWVRGSTVYGPETAGPDGCEFLLIAYGRPVLHHESSE